MNNFYLYRVCATNAKKDCVNDLPHHASLRNDVKSTLKKEKKKYKITHVTHLYMITIYNIVIHI